MASHARLLTFLTMCLVIQGEVTCVSGFGSDLTSMELEDAEHQCQQWISHVDIKTLFQNASEHMACPCIVQLIQYDINFQRHGLCYEELFFRGGVKRLCCYSDNGMLNSRSEDRGYIMVGKYMASIKRFHDICCLTQGTCDLFYDTFPLDDCKHYRSPSVVTSWGDAHIQTVSEDEYDFNGLGEYVYLDVTNVSLTIQCRLEYITESNKDATIFTAFALKVGNNTWQISLNSTSGDLVYNNKSRILQTRAKGNGVILVQLSGLKFPQLFFSGGKYMTLNLASNLLASMESKGLAGNSETGLRMRNNTLIENDSSASSIYVFGQSWKIGNASESVFLYNKERNFTYYNKNVTPPRFPDDYLNDTVKMFTVFGNHSETDIKTFQKLCNVSDKSVKNRCLASIARTNKTDDANTIITYYNVELNKTRLQDYLKDQEPQFTSKFPSDIQLTLNVNTKFVLEVSNYVHDNDTNDTLTYEVTTEGNINIVIDEYNGTLTLYVDETLRHYNGTILVVVKDEWEKPDQQNLLIQFCGCERPSQCGADSATSSKSNVQQTMCNCDQYFNGPFCEIQLDVCNITACYHGVTCDNTTEIIGNTTNPCGQCPTGFSGNGITCTDIDECTSNASNCQQNCTNTVGNYTCSCYGGYSINGTACQDIDECTNADQCKNDSFTQCVNNPGSFSCVCKEDYSRDSNGKCSFDTGKYVYIGQLNLTLTECGENAELDELSLKKHLHLLRPTNDAAFANVEFINITSIKGAPSREIVIFGLRSHTNLNWTYVQLKLADNPNIHWNVTTTTKGHTGGCTAVGKTQLFKEADNMLCKTLDKNKCDKTTTRCVQRNGEALCECKDGYEHRKHGPMNLCYDVDECAAAKGFDCSNNGTCSNINGNWTCECSQGFIARYWSYDNITCEDLDECDDNTKYICRKGSCNNTFGSWECQCNNGYQTGETFGNTKLCEDVDECSTHGFNCSNNGQCRNTLGNWTCDCPVGFLTKYSNYTNIICEDINECNDSSKYACQNGTCHNLVGSWECECNLGYEDGISNGKHICKDVDECSTNGFNCSNNGQCKNTLGNWTCDCPVGFLTKYSNYTNIICEDINECNDSSKYACQNGTCHNLVGSWECECNLGYEDGISNGKHICKDVDECSDTSIDDSCTSTHGTCNNTVGNWTCDCQNGYRAIYYNYENITCEDVNECSSEGFNCSNNGTCINKIGNWTCDCPQGFTSRYWSYDNITCEDLDECNDNTKYVCRKGSCNNTFGSWECQCNIGYQLDETFGNTKWCKDVDECSDTSINDSCISSHGTCNNTEGNWTCDCQEGYQAIYYNYENITCEDIDECQVDNECVHGTCTNSDGGFECECPDNLATKVKKTSGITICSGSNRYQSNMTVNSTKELSETEKHDIATQLEIKIQSIFEEKFENVSVIVTVTIVQVSPPHTHNVKKRAADTPPTAYQYDAVTNTYLNESKAVHVMMQILIEKKSELKNAVEGASKAPVNVDASQLSNSKVITTMKPTPECNRDCQNGGTCQSEKGDNPTCSCPRGYEGDECEDDVAKQLEDPNKDTILYASVGSAGGLIIVIAIVVAVVCRRTSIKRQKSNDEMYMDRLSNTNTVTMYRGNVYVPDTRASHRFAIPRVNLSALSEPDPDYGQPQVFPMVRRDSDMDFSTGSINMDRHNRNPGVVNSLYMHR